MEVNQMAFSVEKEGEEGGSKTINIFC